MSYILQIVRASNLQNWIAINAPGSSRPNARESWRAYLQANGATGGTLGDLERSFISAQVGNTPGEKWRNYTTAQAGGTGKEKIRNLYK